MLPIYTGTPPAYPPPPDTTTYGNGYTGGYVPMMALNSCGDGALIVGIADSVNTDNHDGLFTSTTSGCGATGAKPANTSLPTVSGAAKVGQKLSASPGVWTGTTPIHYAYQWQRCKPGCVNIAGASASSYTPAGADQGTKLRVIVTGSNSAGAAAASSAQVGPVVAGAPSPAAIKSLLAKLLAPSGKLARISALRKHGGYAVSFKAPGRGALTVSWFLVPKGARIFEGEGEGHARREREGDIGQGRHREAHDQAHGQGKVPAGARPQAEADLQGCLYAERRTRSEQHERLHADLTGRNGTVPGDDRAGPEPLRRHRARRTVMGEGLVRRRRTLAGDG